MNEASCLNRSLQYIQGYMKNFQPEVALILGSGLGSVIDRVEILCRIPYAEIAVLPQDKVAGHGAELVCGRLANRSLVIFSGRFHVYQGLSAYEATVPVRLAAALGCRSILLTCAVGGIDPALRPGDFLLVKDHLNFTGINPLQGLHPPPFVDLHNCYQYQFPANLAAIAQDSHRNIQTGVLAYMPGPNYETSAEIKALRQLGAAAVGMSAVLETIMARACQMTVSCLSLVTNFAGGQPQQQLSHQEVLAQSAAASESMQKLLKVMMESKAYEDE